MSTKNQMTINLFDLHFHAGRKLDPEDIFRQLELVASRFCLGPLLSRRFLRVGMELAQNIQSHRRFDRFGLLRARLLPDGVLISSLNFASGPVSENLEKKFHHLISESDIRLGLRKKLSERMASEKENLGDFGLDICILQSQFYRIKRLPVEKEHQLVFQSFFLLAHEKTVHSLHL